MIVGAVLGDGWHTVGFWLAHCWFMVGRMLLYGWRFMLGQRVPNEQSNVGPTKYVAVGPTLNQRLGFGWRMVIVLAGKLLSCAIPCQIVCLSSRYLSRSFLHRLADLFLSYAYGLQVVTCEVHQYCRL